VDNRIKTERDDFFAVIYDTKLFNNKLLAAKDNYENLSIRRDIEATAELTGITVVSAFSLGLFAIPYVAYAAATGHPTPSSSFRRLAAERRIRKADENNLSRDNGVFLRNLLMGEGGSDPLSFKFYLCEELTGEHTGDLVSKCLGFLNDGLELDNVLHKNSQIGNKR